jgi:histone H3/H4
MGMKISKASIAVFNEVVFGFVEGFAKDLESFAKHAKRSTIKPEESVQFSAQTHTHTHTHTLNTHTHTHTHTEIPFISSVLS